MILSAKSVGPEKSFVIFTVVQLLQYIVLLQCDDVYLLPDQIQVCEGATNSVRFVILFCFAANSDTKD